MGNPSASRNPRASSVAKWIGGREACRILDCSQSAVQRAALFGLIRVTLQPGFPPRYDRKSVERYAVIKAAKVPRKKKPRRSGETGEVVSEPPVDAGGPGRTNETLKPRASS
jgi:hypothetical protein